MLPYLRSVERHNTFAETFLVGVGWKPPAEHGFAPVELPLEQATGLNRVFCVQHGAFLNTLVCDPDDIIIYTDGGDVVMQRDFSDDERALIVGLDNTTVLVGWNAGPDDTLDTERERLHPRGRRSRLGAWKERYRDVLQLPVYNTGVIVATARAYWLLFLRYMEMWDEVNALFDHYANIQWCISWALGTHPLLRVQVLSQAIHTHGHYPLPAGTSAEGETLYFEDRLVLFRHKYPNQYHSAVPRHPRAVAVSGAGIGAAGVSRV
jgi:hypothetical protein